ncbi:hypothetical protein ACQCRO_26495, partial [Ralstonia pseudosolanacearum]|uniref:hypothetical protein n=1 Tax=Ralstonia pseudosolanacearum TaxID=1310165 RepID=UPI003CE836A3
PYMDGSFKINDGLRTARELLVNINEQGMSRAQAARAGTTVAYGHGNPPKAADREARASRSA